MGQFEDEEETGPGKGEERERMRTGGGGCVPGTSQGSEDIDEALLEATNIELQYVYDSDVGELFRDLIAKHENGPVKYTDYFN